MLKSTTASWFCLGCQISGKAKAQKNARQKRPRQRDPRPYSCQIQLEGKLIECWWEACNGRHTSLARNGRQGSMSRLLSPSHLLRLTYCGWFYPQSWSTLLSYSHQRLTAVLLTRSPQIPHFEYAFILASAWFNWNEERCHHLIQLPQILLIRTHILLLHLHRLRNALHRLQTASISRDSFGQHHLVLQKPRIFLPIFPDEMRNSNQARCQLWQVLGLLEFR